MRERDGLEMVVPRGFDRRRIAAILEDKRAWIDKAWRRVDEHRRRLELEPPHLPTRIESPALGREWEVEYRRGSGRRRGLSGAGAQGPSARPDPGRVLVRENQGRLVVSGDIDDLEAVGDALARWLSRTARAGLVPWLERLGREYGLLHRRVTIRHQKSRWGSCSRNKTVSLNARLLFLPPELVEHVLLHELCHLVELNHSPRFWRVLEACDPRWRDHRSALRRAGAWVPTWVDHPVLPPASGGGAAGPVPAYALP